MYHNDTYGGLQTTNSTPLSLQPGGGNVGIGTTSPQRLLHMSAAGAEFIMEDTGQSANQKRFNIYMNSGKTNFRTLNDAGNGGTTWLTADNSNGNVGIGTTSPGTKLHVNGGIRVEGGNPGFQIYSGSTERMHLTSDGSLLQLNTGATNSDIAFVNDSGSTRMTIKTSSGNVGIGTTSPGYKLDVSGNARFTDLYLTDGTQIEGLSGRNYFRDAEGAGNLRVGAAWGMPGIYAESGNAVVGAAGGWVYLRNNAILDSGNMYINNTGLVIGGKLNIAFDGSSEQGINIKNNSGIAPGAAIRFIDSGNGYSGGGIYFSSSNSITYATSSDRRLKENIAPTARGLDKLMAIEVDDFNFITEKDKRVQGFIAQDLVKIYPEAVKVGGEGTDKNPWSVDYGRVTPLLVKSIQELKALFDTLAAKVVKLAGEVEKLIARVTVHEEAIKKLQAANDNLERENKVLVKRIEALEQRFRAGNDNDEHPMLKKAVGFGPAKGKE